MCLDLMTQCSQLNVHNLPLNDHRFGDTGSLYIVSMEAKANRKMQYFHNFLLISIALK